MADKARDPIIEESRQELENLKLEKRRKTVREAASRCRERYTRFQITVEKDMAKRIRIKCIEEDIQVSEIIRRAFDLWLDGKIDFLDTKDKPKVGAKMRLPEDLP